MIQATIKERLGVYIRNLMINEPGMVPYYLVFLPASSLAESLPQIVSNYEEFMGIDEQVVGSLRGWPYIKDKYGRRGQGPTFMTALSGLMKKLIQK